MFEAVRFRSEADLAEGQQPAKSRHCWRVLSHLNRLRV